MNQMSMNGANTAENLLTLTCPTCGSKLKVTAQVHLLVCANCGNEYMVHRDGGAVYLGPIAQDVKQIRVGVDKTAAELAVVRLTKEIAVVDNEIQDAKLSDYSTQVPPIENQRGITIAVASSFFGTFGFLSLAAIYASWGFGILTLISLIALAWTLVTANDSSDKRDGEVARVKQADLERLNSTRRSKIAALQKNHEIASS